MLSVLEWKNPKVTIGEAPVALPTGTITFLFTDIEGSTRLWATDAAKMSASLRQHDDILRSCIEERAGYVFTTAGDSFAAAFDRASDAVAAAVRIQERLQSTTWPGPVLRVRIGMHLCEAEERNGDYFGPVVNTAARVESAGHGGQILITESVRMAAGVAADDLGVHSLRDVEAPMRLFQVGDGSFPLLRVVDEHLSNLPTRPTRLVGRDDELIRIRKLIADRRLVTLTALGGSGKTRLAIAVGEEELVHRPGGVWFVDLTSVTNGADVPTAIATSAGLSLARGDATEQLMRYFADKAALLIVDNCEHVVDACAEFAERFLATAGRTKILATSREALDVEGEQVIVLGPLATDSVESPAVRLFVDRASAADAEFALSQSNANAISELCTHLDGLPLAIELAAARITVMTPEELLLALGDRFEVLGSGRRRQRHRTLEQTLDWSYDLLHVDEQRVFRSLGVFVDGFDIDAVAAVTDSARASAVAMVTALSAKSLIVRTDNRSTSRFRLLETVKAYAEKRLSEDLESAAVRDRHLLYFHGLAMGEGRVALGTVEIGARLRHDTGNVGLAFESAANTDRWSMAAELVCGSSMAYFLDVRLLALRELVVAALDKGDALDGHLRDCLTTQLLYVSAWLSDWTTTISTAMDMAKHTTPSFRAIGQTYLAWGFALFDLDRVPTLLSDADASLDAVTEEDDPGVVRLARWFHARARAAQALMSLEPQRGLDVGVEIIGTPVPRNQWTYLQLDATAVMSVCQILAGQPDAALRTVAALPEYDLPYYDGTELRALVSLSRGDLDEARDHISRYAARAATGRLTSESADAVLLLAALAHAECDDGTAVALLGQMGLGRQLATIGYGLYLANRLGVADDYQAMLLLSLGYQADSEQGTAGSKLSMAALVGDMVRRGWQNPHAPLAIATPSQPVGASKLSDVISSALADIGRSKEPG